MSRPKVHLICNAHLDPVWQWRWEEGCAEALSTFATAVQFLTEHDQLIFNHNEAVLYRWVERYDPLLFAQIREMVAAGRWSISGGWYLQPDANLPGMESFIRHIAEGRRFFWDRFGVRPRVAYNFDSFGHHGGLPQLLRQAGIEMYVHMRPEKHDLSLPSDLYRWVGVDGSEILTYRIAVGLYHTERDNIERRLKEGTELALRLNRDVPVFWGLGNHGGGATREDLRIIDDFVAAETRLEVVHSTLERLLDCLRPYAYTAPIVKGDLQRVFTGCYTSISRLKRRARASLAELSQCEALCAAAWWQGQLEYPDQTLDAIWRDHLFNDFHDILPGTCTEPAERDALDLYGRVSQTAREMKLDSVCALNQSHQPSVELPVVIANSNPAMQRVPVEIEFMVDYRPLWAGLWHTRLFSDLGDEIVAQEEQPAARLPFNGWRRKLVALVELPGIGVSRFQIKRFEGSQINSPHPTKLNHSINERSGLVDQIRTASGRECLAGNLFQAIVAVDRGDSWGTDQWGALEPAGQFELDEAPRIVAAGPVRTVTESCFQFRSSRILLQTIAWCDWPVLEFRFLVAWNQARQRLKLTIPTKFRGGRPECEIPAGMISRPNDGSLQVHGRWFLMSDASESDPVAIGVVNSGQHGIECQDGRVELSVLRSAAYCHEQGQSLDILPASRFMDQGEHEFRLLVTVGRPDEVRHRLSALADWLDAPPVVYSHLRPRTGNVLSGELFPESHNSPSGSQGGVKSASVADNGGRSLLQIEPSSVRLTACKKAAASDALIVRLQESVGQATSALIEINGVPDRIELSFEKFEIKTLRIERGGAWRIVNMIEET